MADQEYRSFIVGEQFFKQVQGVDVQVVRGFIQHQHIGWPGEQPGEQQTVAFPAGQ